MTGRKPALPSCIDCGQAVWCVALSVEVTDQDDTDHFIRRVQWLGGWTGTVVEMDNKEIEKSLPLPGFEPRFLSRKTYSHQVPLNEAPTNRHRQTVVLC
jgi:hypothetical protein